MINHPQIVNDNALVLLPRQAAPSFSSNNNASNERTRGKSSKVQFNPMARVYFIGNLDSFSSQEVTESYYLPNELKKVKAELKFTAKLLELGDLTSDTTEYCARGTEYPTKKGATKRIKNKELGWEAVLEEQDLQWEMGIYDPIAIASLYKAATSECQEEAHNLALKDQGAGHEDSGRASCIPCWTKR